MTSTTVRIGTVLATVALATGMGTVTAEAKSLPPGYRPNGCTMSPDRGVYPVYYDFKQACNRHDYCYDELWYGGGETGRHRCDDNFLHEMRGWCSSHHRYNPQALGKCYGVAQTYYSVVRHSGRSYFDNPWKN